MLETSPFQKIREKVNHKLCENDSFNGITKVLGQQQKRRVIPVDQQIPLSFFKKKTVQVFVWMGNPKLRVPAAPHLSYFWHQRIIRIWICQ